MKVTGRQRWYLVFLLVFGAYLVFADYIFNALIRTSKESVRASIDLPAASDSILFGIEEVRYRKVQWKEMLVIRGWLFRKHVEEEKRTVFMVLESAGRQTVIKIKRADINRPDLIKRFHLNGKVWNLGFSAVIPRYFLKSGTYRIGFVIFDTTGRYYTATNISVKLGKSSATISTAGAGTAP